MLQLVHGSDLAVTGLAHVRCAALAPGSRDRYAELQG